MASTVETVAVWLALVTALVPIVIVAGVWLLIQGPVRTRRDDRPTLH